jgi:hypothetical protein
MEVGGYFIERLIELFCLFIWENGGWNWKCWHGKIHIGNKDLMNCLIFEELVIL